MKNVLFVIGEYKPNLSPNGKIADNIIQLLKNKHNILVLSRSTNFHLRKEEIIDGIKVIRIPDWNLSIHNYLTYKIKKSKNIIEKQIYLTLLFIKRVLYYILRLVQKYSISRVYKNKLVKTLIKINSNHTIDIIIPVSAPHEEVFAAVEFKKRNPSCKLFIYQLDRFSNANSLYLTNLNKSKKIERNIQLELEALASCDKLLILTPLQKHFLNERFSDYNEKIIITEHPLVEDKVITHTRTDDDPNIIYTIYAGSLNKKLRNPSYLFEIYNDSTVKSHNIILNLYAFGDCQSIIDKYQKMTDGIIFDYGKVSPIEIDQELQKTDILITLGNNSANEVPSKLFEYVSYGKPIVHFYYNDNDAYLNYLKNYKYSICLKIDYGLLSSNRKQFVDFCLRMKNMVIPFEAVENIFGKCTPRHVANQFNEIIES